MNFWQYSKFWSAYQKYLKSSYCTSSEDLLCLHKPHSFSTNRSPKNAGTKHFMFGGRFGASKTGAEYGLHSTLADFFHHIKVCQWKRRIILYLAAQNFIYFSKKKFKINIKKFKNIQWLTSILGLSNSTTLRPIQLTLQNT